MVSLFCESSFQFEFPKSGTVVNSVDLVQTPGLQATDPGSRKGNGDGKWSCWDLETVETVRKGKQKKWCEALFYISDSARFLHTKHAETTPRTFEWSENSRNGQNRREKRWNRPNIRVKIILKIPNTRKPTKHKSLV